MRPYQSTPPRSLSSRSPSRCRHSPTLPPTATTQRKTPPALFLALICRRGLPQRQFISGQATFQPPSASTTTPSKLQGLTAASVSRVRAQSPPWLTPVRRRCHSAGALPGCSRPAQTAGAHKQSSVRPEANLPRRGHAAGDALLAVTVLHIRAPIDHKCVPRHLLVRCTYHSRTHNVLARRPIRACHLACLQCCAIASASSPAETLTCSCRLCHLSTFAYIDLGLFLVSHAVPGPLSPVTNVLCVGECPEPAASGFVVHAVRK